MITNRPSADTAGVALLKNSSGWSLPAWPNSCHFFTSLFDVADPFHSILDSPFAESSPSPTDIPEYKYNFPSSTRADRPGGRRSEEHTSELQSRENLVCRLLLEKKKKQRNYYTAWLTMCRAMLL